uniref:Uncharacterized protein n=1 Tax=Arundo donax TaxID=35708 RepID=A0A0A9E2C4_ARUDO
MLTELSDGHSQQMTQANDSKKPSFTHKELSTNIQTGDTDTITKQCRMKMSRRFEWHFLQCVRT